MSGELYTSDKKDALFRAQILALNLKLDMTKKRLAFAVHLLNETNRVATKMKCREFPASLKIDIRQFLGKDITPCEGGAQ